MNTVKQLLEVKGNEVWSVSPDTSVLEALQLMAEKNVGALLVLKAGQVVGIFSERDYARKVILAGRNSQHTTVDQIMSTKVLYVTPEQTVSECMALMTDKHLRHLPVMEKRRLRGVISIGDIVGAIIGEQEFLIEQLERYVTGT